MIIALRRYYAKHKHTTQYEKRVSWIDEGLDDDPPTVSDRRAASGDQATVNPACMQRTATTGIGQTETMIQR